LVGVSEAANCVDAQGVAGPEEAAASEAVAAILDGARAAMGGPPEQVASALEQAHAALQAMLAEGEV
jgi:hypothetical protein